MELNTRYIIDLTHAQSAADVVFELSNIIEKQEAANKKIWLKLGDITLNQSQLLSINSLINSINSTLSLIESDSQQTELAAATLGISTKDVEEEIQEELSALEAQAPVDTPSEQYIPMTDHIQESATETENKTDEIKPSEHNDENNNSGTDVEVFETEEKNNNKDNDSELTDSLTSIEHFSLSENSTRNSDSDIFSPKEELADKKSESGTETSAHEFSESKDAEDLTEDDKEKKEEEIQEQLDSIFDSETKLENILSEEKELSDMKNWPLTKEAEDFFEIPEEEMTDEDYEILQMNTQYHKQTVRSGQVIKSNGNVVIIGDCHPGCEIHAAGDITVWGILGGIAHAGCKGNTKARIRALTLNAIQLRIADSYARRPDHIKNIYVEKSNTFTPEEARNINGSIVILKINDNK